MARFFRSPVAGWRAAHPEWWLLAVSGIAWAGIELSPRLAWLPQLCLPASLGRFAALEAGWSAGDPTASLPSIGAQLALMTVAMMLPLIVLPVRHVAFRSLASRRRLAMAEFVVGYLAPWFAIAAAFVPALLVFERLAGTERVAVIAGAVAATLVWQETPGKRHALLRCHRTVPLPPLGREADLACLRFGFATGCNCVAGCWALMSLAAIAGHTLVAMAWFEAILVGERYRRPSPPARLGFALLLCVPALLEIRASLPGLSPG